MDASPHLWYRMGQALIKGLYDPDLNLFRETWGDLAGRCWYWNTEQGEALQLLVAMENSTLISEIIGGYMRHLVYNHGDRMWLFTRYTPCRQFRVLSLDPGNFSIGNYLINLGGDLSGERSENDIYRRAIIISMDAYKDQLQGREQKVAWISNHYIASIKATEVWYVSNGSNNSYKGFWDTSDGSLGTGRIIDYDITIGNNTYITRVMSDRSLVYTQEFILERGAPWITLKMKVHNNSSIVLRNVRVTLSFDNLDLLHYHVVYIPGIGYVYASRSGKLIGYGSEKEYHLAYSWEGDWREIRDSHSREWWPSIIYSDDPIGMNRAMLVLIDAHYKVHFWGYGNKQTISNESPTGEVIERWYYRWLKFEVIIGDLKPNETKIVEARIIPFEGYIPGLEDVILDMASDMYSLMGRDWSFAANTGTGAFSGLTLAFPYAEDYDDRWTEFVERLMYTLGNIMGSSDWNVSTRILSNFIVGLVNLYEYTGNKSYLYLAIDAGNELLKRQIKNPVDPRDGGFLDAKYPYGAATYLDVNAEVARALLTLSNKTKNATYKAAVDYFMEHWFHYSHRDGWYYYRFEDVDKAPSPILFKGSLESEQPYALGYFLYATASEYWNDTKLLTAANTVWTLLQSDYWELTSPRSKESNVETQCGAVLGLRSYNNALMKHLGIAIEYVKGGNLSIHYKIKNTTINGNIYQGVEIMGNITERKNETIVALYVPKALLKSILIGGTHAQRAKDISELQISTYDVYYYDTHDHILYIKLVNNNDFIINLLITEKIINAETRKNSQVIITILILIFLIIVITKYLGKRIHKPPNNIN